EGLLRPRRRVSEHRLPRIPVGAESRRRRVRRARQAHRAEGKAARQVHGDRESPGARDARVQHYRLPAGVVEDDKLDYELLDRWVKFLAKPPKFYPFVKDWQAMIKAGGTAAEAKALA